MVGHVVNDKTLAFLTLGVSVASLIVTYKMAMALQQAKADIDKTVSGAKENPLTALLGKATGIW